MQKMGTESGHPGESEPRILGRGPVTTRGRRRGSGHKWKDVHLSRSGGDQLTRGEETAWVGKCGCNLKKLTISTSFWTLGAFLFG